LRHGLANRLLPCELLYATARREVHPPVKISRSQTTGEFITRVDTNIPESMKKGLVGRAITDVNQVPEMERVRGQGRG